MLGIFRTKEQGDGSLPGCSPQLFDVLALIIQFRGVSLLKLLPLVRIVCEPFPQLGTRREFLKPLIDVRFLLRQSPRPESINQYAMAVGFRWLVVNTFEPNAHVLLSQRIRRSAVRVASEADNPACPQLSQTGLPVSHHCRTLEEKMRSKAIDDFLRLLKHSPGDAVFNPWWEVDKQNDTGRIAPAIRRRQLRAYLRRRQGKAKLALIGEAVGYRGGHFSGIPMTSERILLGKKTDVVAALCERRKICRRTRHGGHRSPLQILAGVKPRRTSKPRKCPDGFSEATATIVWSTLLKLGLRPEQFVLWNAFPWHSFDRRRGMLSNRMPNKSEQAAGQPALKAFLELFPCEHIVALGKTAAVQLEELEVDFQHVRHPASGGAKLFRQQIAKVVEPSSSRTWAVRPS